MPTHVAGKPGAHQSPGAVSVTAVLLVVGVRAGQPLSSGRLGIQIGTGAALLVSVVRPGAGMVGPPNAIAELSSCSAGAPDWWLSSEAALNTFGDHGMAEIVFLVGCFSMVGITLNAFDASVPGREEHLDE